MLSSYIFIYSISSRFLDVFQFFIILISLGKIIGDILKDNTYSEMSAVTNFLPTYSLFNYFFFVFLVYITTNLAYSYILFFFHIKLKITFSYLNLENVTLNIFCIRLCRIIELKSKLIIN